MDYKPNAIAKSLKSNKTNSIGVIIPDISNPYFMTIAKGIEDAITDSDYNMIFVSGDEDSVKEEKMLNVLIEKRVDALILATSGKNEELIYNINKTNVPILLIDRKLNGNTNEMDFVVEDNVKATYNVTNHLIKKGHSKIGIVNGSLRVSTGIERFKGFVLALQKNNIFLDEKYIFNGKFTIDDGVRAVDHFMTLEDKPTAILSFNNTMTQGVLFRLTELENSFSKNVQLATYGEIEMAYLCKSLNILSVIQDPYHMGKKAGQILMKRLGSEGIVKAEKVYFTPKYNFKI